MKRLLFGYALFLGFCLCLPIPLQAWNAEGHMVVAQIAYNHLDPAVKTKCDSLIAVPLTYADDGTSNFITAAVWADTYKSQLGSAIWHYIDLPFSLDGTNTSGVSTASFDVVRAIRQCVSILQNTNQTQTNLATNLRYLLHFVGDIQQPLHCSTAVSASFPHGDSGGNSFSLTPTTPNFYNNLHSLWDGGGGFLEDSVSRPLDSTEQSTISNKAALVEAAYPFVSNFGTIPDPMDWAQEGLGLAKTVSYVGITRNTNPSSSYTNTAQATTEQRMAQGGYRLANLLNTIFASPFPLTSLKTTNGNFAFSWSASPGRTYRIQWKPQASVAGWSNLMDLTATSNSITWADSATQSTRLYRVTVAN